MAHVDVVQVLSEAVTRAGCAPFAAGEGAEAVVIRAVPGRLDVMGALGAGAGGTVAQMALPARVAVGVQRWAEPVIVVRAAGMDIAAGAGEARIDLAEGEVVVAGGCPFAGLVVGMWRALRERGVALPGGFGVKIQNGIALGAGQAASMALLAALASALVGAGDPVERAELVARAEVLGGGVAMPSAGRVVDAMTCLLGEEGRLLRFSAQPHRLVGSVPLPGDLRILAIDTGVRAEGNQRETLEELRIAGAMGVRIIDQIYTDLGQAHTPLHGYLANTSPLLYRQYFRMLLPKRLRGSDFVRTYGAGEMVMDEAGAAKFYRVRTAVDHLMAEHEHAEQFVQAMEELEDLRDGVHWGDAEDEAERQRVLQRAGRLALASHHSYRLRLELSCAEADWLVDRLMAAGPERGVYGARITGAGAGGTVMALVSRSGMGTDALLEVMTAYQREMGRVLGVVEAGRARVSYGDETSEGNRR